VSEDLVEIERGDDVVVITLDRAESRNAMNVSLAAATCAAIDSCQDALAIVLTGRDPAFCAGLDLRELGTDLLGDLPPFIAAVEGSAVPVIAAVNGPAVTGGFELALACDFIIASERAAFADTHLRVGVYPGPVAVYLPRRVGDAWARQMSLTGDFVDASTALRIGIANEVVPHDELLDRATAVARSIADHDPEMVQALRADLVATVGLPIADGHRIHDEFALRRGLRGSRSNEIAARREAVLERARQQRTTWGTP
jgi:enoyl-CoA hydratase